MLVKSLMNKLNKKIGYIFKRMLESLKNTLHIPGMTLKRGTYLSEEQAKTI